MLLSRSILWFAVQCFRSSTAITLQPARFHVPPLRGDQFPSSLASPGRVSPVSIPASALLYSVSWPFVSRPVDSHALCYSRAHPIDSRPMHCFTLRSSLSVPTITARSIPVAYGALPCTPVRPRHTHGVPCPASTSGHVQYSRANPNPWLFRLLPCFALLLTPIR